MVLIPWQSLTADALEGIIDDYVLREGTDYTESTNAPSLCDKRDAVLGQLRDGQASIVYNPELQSADIQLTSELPDSAST